MKHKNGNWYWLESREIIHMRKPDGSPKQIFGAIRDITEQKEATNNLRTNEKSLKKAQEVAHLGNWSWDLQTNKLMWSEENYKIFGLSKDVVPTYENFEKTIHPDDFELVNKSVEKTIKDGKSYNIDFRIILPGNKVRTVNAIGEVIYDEMTKKPLTFFGTVQDITGRKEVEEKLSFQSSLLEQVHNGIIAVDFDYKIIYWNKFAEKLYQWKSEEVLGENIVELLLINQELNFQFS